MPSKCNKLAKIVIPLTSQKNFNAYFVVTVEK